MQQESARLIALGSKGVSQATVTSMDSSSVTVPRVPAQRRAAQALSWRQVNYSQQAFKPFFIYLFLYLFIYICIYFFFLFIE